MQILNRYTFFLSYFLFYSTLTFCQTGTEELLLKYPFIQVDSNQILLPDNLHVFFSRLAELKRSKEGRIVVAHFGDSHVQAGYFSEPLRRNLQAEFGFAGRGLIFPYQAARTNGAPDYSGTSQNHWKSWRNSIGGLASGTGIAGHAVYTREKDARIHFRLRDVAGEMPPEKLILFHGSKQDSNYVYRILDSTGTSIGTSIPLTKPYPWCSAFDLNHQAKKFTIAHDRDSAGRSSVIYGISAENSQTGILFHTVGSNGAEYRHFAGAKFFMPQLQSLSPDLVIISLGTNEAFNSKNFDPLRVYAQADSLVAQIQQACPDAAILLTTPPEIGMLVRGGKNRKSYYYTANPRIAEIRGQLLKLAQVRNLSVWDFYTVMGGHGSVAKWNKAGLTDKRRIHFNRTGYTMQGYLLWKAIMKAYSSQQFN